MKRLLVTLAVVLVAGLPATAGADKKGKAFLGLWGGVDPVDGSTQRVLIGRGANGGFYLVWHEDYWRICKGRRGIMKGEGMLDAEHKDTLVTSRVITCFDPEEIVREDTLTFRLADKNMLLATAGNQVFVDMPLYRLSQSLK